MSSLSEIFLMHLKATALQSSEVSIVQDNANSSRDLSKFFFESRSANSSFTTITWSRSRTSTSRWEPAVAIDDDQPDIPTRQDSCKILMPPTDDCNDSFSEEDNTKDSQPKIPLRQSSGRNLLLATAAACLPRIPRRQKSFHNPLGGSLHGSNHERMPPIMPHRRQFRRAKSFSMVLEPAFALAVPALQ